MPITPISQTIGLVNPSLNSLGFEIRNGISEDNGTQFYAMCNLRSDAGSRLATHFRAVELVFFKSIVRFLSSPLGETIEAFSSNIHGQPFQRRLPLLVTGQPIKGHICQLEYCLEMVMRDERREYGKKLGLRG